MTMTTTDAAADATADDGGFEGGAVTLHGWTAKHWIVATVIAVVAVAAFSMTWA